jgi:hypothetical protein
LRMVCRAFARVYYTTQLNLNYLNPKPYIHWPVHTTLHY